MRIRLDTLLVRRGLAPSREKAQRLILAGAVRVGGQPAVKVSQLACEQAIVEVTKPDRYVSRGGYKLQAALAAFDVPCTNAICVDIGASTGGFTDCLLQHGARRVHAVDVGQGQLAWSLRRDPRVVVHERTNARYLTADALGESADIITIDVSFISLKKILPAAAQLLRSGGWLIALIKPQFEAGRAKVGRGGVVRDAAVHQAVQQDLADFARDTLGLTVVGTMESPLRGPAGNKEFFIALRKP